MTRRNRSRDARPVGANVHCAACNRIICRLVDGGEGFEDFRHGASITVLDPDHIVLCCPSTKCPRHDVGHTLRAMAVLEQWRLTYRSGGRSAVYLREILFPSA